MSEIKRATELRPGDVVIGRHGEPFPVGPLELEYASDRYRDGNRKGLYLHWRGRGYAHLNARDDDTFDVQPPRSLGAQEDGPSHLEGERE